MNYNKTRKILVVDDEVLIAETIQDYLVDLKFSQIKLAHDVQSAISFINLFKPDLVLLDIRLVDEAEGLEIGEKLTSEFNIPFMYITAHSDINMSSKILETKPIAYLTKPLNKTQFSISIQNYFNQLNPPSNSLIVEIGKTEVVINESDMLYLQAFGNYWELHTKKGKHLLRKTVEEIKNEEWAAHFTRVHRSYMVNLAEIRELKGGKIILHNNQTIPVSRSNVQTIKEELVDFLKNR